MGGLHLPALNQCCEIILTDWCKTVLCISSADALEIPQFCIEPWYQNANPNLIFFKMIQDVKNWQVNVWIFQPWYLTCQNQLISFYQPAICGRTFKWFPDILWFYIHFVSQNLYCYIDCYIDCSVYSVLIYILEISFRTFVKSFQFNLHLVSMSDVFQVSCFEMHWVRFKELEVFISRFYGVFLYDFFYLIPVKCNNKTPSRVDVNAGLILGLHPANERHHYKVMLSLIGCAQT